jgi:hypothetical protein
MMSLRLTVGDLLREAIKSILQEKGNIPDVVKHTRISDPAGKLVLIMPGIDNAYGISSMADYCKKRANELLPESVSYIIPRDYRVSVAMALGEIKKQNVADLDSAGELMLAGFSAGGGSSLSFMSRSGDASMFDKFYLMDPSPVVATLPAAIGAKTLMIHNWRNWSEGATKRKPNFDSLSKSINAAGGQAEETKLGHMAIFDEGLKRIAQGM